MGIPDFPFRTMMVLALIGAVAALCGGIWVVYQLFQHLHWA